MYQGCSGTSEGSITLTIAVLGHVCGRIAGDHGQNVERGEQLAFTKRSARIIPIIHTPLFIGVPAGQLPAIVICSIRSDPVRMAPRVSTSAPTSRIPRNMSARLPAMVISSTGYAISPPSTQKPAAPRE